MKNSHSRLSKVIAIVLTLVMLIGIVPVSAATPIGSSDQGDGTYTNPFIWADVPDLDIIRVGDTYWMSSTTMHMSPGVPIMKSYDLVNWETVSYCYYALEDMDSMKLQTGNNMYGNGTWASSLRYKDGTFYLVVPSATSGKTYIFQTEDPENQAWRRYEINQRFHDCSLLLDDDGRNWLFYGSGQLIELNSDVTGLKEGARSIKVMDSLHAPDPVTGITPTSGLNEGAHIMKINGKYYIFGITWPSGKPRTQVCHIADEITGPYRSRVVGQEDVRYGNSGGGPAQGAIVDDGNGNWYGFNFRDSGSVGRIPWLMPITWDGEWPMFGQDEDGNPSYTGLAREGAIPMTGFETTSIVTSDEFYNNEERPVYYDNVIEAEVEEDTDPTPDVPTLDPVDSTENAGMELITNGGFEDGTEGWFDNDTYDSDDATIAVTDEDKVSGDYSLYVSGRTSTGSGPMQDLTGKMKAGGVYEVSARIKYTTGPANRQFYMTLRSETPVSDSNIMKNIRGARITKGEWGTISGTYRVPEDADESAMAIFLETSWTANPTAENDLMDFYVDDVSIKVVSEPVIPEVDVIDNGGFEEENQGEWIPHTTSCDAADVDLPAVTITSDEAHSGSNSILVTNRQAVGVGPRQNLSGELIAGATYEVSAWVKYNNEASPDTQGFQYSLKYSDVTWEHVAEATANKGEWTQITGTYTVPKSGDVDNVFMFIETIPWVSNSDAKANPDRYLMDFYVDDVSMKLVSLPVPGDPLESILGGQYSYNGSNLNMAWQWNHNPDNRYWSLTEREGWLRLRTGYISTNILDAPNTLTQRTFGPQSSATIKLDVSHMQNGDAAGLSLFTARYGAISVRMANGAKTLVMTNSSSTTNHTDVASVELTSDIVYLKADADFFEQTDKGTFYYSYDGINWTQLGDTLQMVYGTDNHFMGYRFAIFNYATQATGGYVDVDYYRISDKLTGATEPTVLDVEMQGAADVAGVAVSEVEVPVLIDSLPEGNYSEIAASFSIPDDLTVEDVVFGDDLIGEGTWEVDENQLELTVTGDKVDLQAAEGKALFATIKVRVNKLQAIDNTISIVPDYVIVRGDGNVVCDTNGVQADISLVKTENGGAYAKFPGYSNPLITHKYGADPFAMVYKDRVYVYMTNDSQSYELQQASDGSNNYGQINSLNVISSDDMVNWTDHGSVKIGSRDGGVTEWANNSWAPSAAWKNIDGEDKFFLYYCNSANGIGVLTADSPTGPFTDPLGHALIDRSTPNCSNQDVPWLFDPAVFVDDDGTGYLYFGGGIDGLDANNPCSARAVQLGDDMISIVGEPVEIDAPRLFEDSGMHKYNGIYYYSYCSNFSGQSGEGYPPTGTIAYMVSKSPLGPFTYAGTVLPGPGVYGNGDGGNNHHAIFEFNGKYYIAYHSRQVNIFERQDQGKTGNKDYRSTNISEIKFDSTNRIIERQMDYDGVDQIKTLDPYARVEAETIGWNYGIKTEAIAETNQPSNMKVISINDGDWIGNGQADFGENGTTKFTAMVAGRAGGTIEIVLDSLDGTKVGELVVPAGDGTEMQLLETTIEGVSGVHDIFFRYVGSDEDMFDIDYWQFIENGEEPEIVISTDKDTYYQNEIINVTITAPYDYLDLGFTNEYGSWMGTAVTDFVDNGDSITWTMTISIGSKGDRTINVMNGSEKIGEFNVTILAGSPPEYPDESAEIISAEASSRVVLAGKNFTVKVVTGRGASDVKLFNEYGSEFGKTLVSKEIVGDTIEWEYTMNIGSKGIRNITVKSADAQGNWLDDTASIKISVVK